MSANQKFKNQDWWVVIPGYNEEKYLGQVLQKVKKITPNIIFVDDGSKDNTYQIAQKEISEVLRHEINLGKGAAMLTGAEYAFTNLGSKGIIFFDSDDQHNPEELPLFFEKLDQGADVVFGVRKFTSANMPLLRFLGNKLASASLTIMFGKYIPDIPSGYKALSQRAFKKVRWNSTGYQVESEIAARVAKQNIPFEVVEIETIYHDTDKGMNGIEAGKILWSLLKWRVGW